MAQSCEFRFPVNKVILRFLPSLSLLRRVILELSVSSVLLLPFQPQTQ